MGLGKTVQIASFFSVISSTHNIWPFMVVAPTSLLSNWLNELQKWAPHLISVIYNGTKTARDLILTHEIKPDESMKYDPSALRCHVVLTNYETLMLESGLFKKISWRALVCDEGHRLKNDAAKTFSALQKLDGDHKIVLTGTPLQNNMRELFNLMKFLDPDKFNDQEEWEEKYGDLTDENAVIELHSVFFDVGTDILDSSTSFPKKNKTIGFDIVATKGRSSHLEDLIID
jgi:SNF2 family DNA or RNA helicase